jgi:hypothetical protein
MSEYEKLKAYFKDSEYIPTKIECRACGSVVQIGDVRCGMCDNMLVWCEASVKKTNGTTRVKV